MFLVFSNVSDMLGPGNILNEVVFPSEVRNYTESASSTRLRVIEIPPTPHVVYYKALWGEGGGSLKTICTARKHSRVLGLFSYKETIFILLLLFFFSVRKSSL